jgi:hypothetical protein
MRAGSSVNAGLIAFSTTSQSFSVIHHLFSSNKKPALAGLLVYFLAGQVIWRD